MSMGRQRPCRPYHGQRQGLGVGGAWVELLSLFSSLHTHHSRREALSLSRARARVVQPVQMPTPRPGTQATRPSTSLLAPAGRGRGGLAGPAKRANARPAPPAPPALPSLGSLWPPSSSSSSLPVARRRTLAPGLTIGPIGIGTWAWGNRFLYQVRREERRGKGAFLSLSLHPPPLIIFFLSLSLSPFFLSTGRTRTPPWAKPTPPPWPPASTCLTRATRTGRGACPGGRRPC